MEKNREITKFDLIFLIILMGFAFFRYSIMAIIVASYPFIETEFSLSFFELSLINVIFYSVSFFSSYFWLYLAGKTSNSIAFISGSLLWMIPVMLISLSKSFFMFIFFVALVGAGTESTNIVLYNYFIGLKFNRTFARAYSLITIVQGAGGVFGAFFTAQIQDIMDLEWRMVFFYIFLIIISLWFIIAFIILFRPKKLNVVMTNKKSYSITFLRLIQIIKQKKNLLVYLILIISSVGLSYLNVWTQKYFQTVHGVSQTISVISFIFLSGGEFLAYVVGGFVFDKLRKMNNKIFPYLGFLSLFISAILFTISLSIPWILEEVAGENFIEICWNLLLSAFNDIKIALFYISIFLAFFSFTFSIPFLIGVLNFTNNHEDRNVLIYVWNTLLVVLYLIFPPIGGIIADNFGLRIMFFVIPFSLYFALIPIISLTKITKSLYNTTDIFSKDIEIN